MHRLVLLGIRNSRNICAAQAYIRASVSLVRLQYKSLYTVSIRLCVSAVGACHGICPPVSRRVLGGWRMSESRQHLLKSLWCVMLS